jgi:hypothetical protein
MEEAKTPDEISGNASGIALTIRLEGKNTVVLEGSRESLRFLGELLLAQAEAAVDCGFQLSPRGAGSAHFALGATCGIYIHRLPCADGQHAG